MTLTSLALVAVLAQSPQAPPDAIEQVTVGALFGSSSISMVPVWITAACTTARTCTDLNPFMARMIGKGPVRAASFKAGLSFVAHYGIWRIDAKTTKQRIFRLVAALSLLGFNIWDAVHDVRVLREIDRRRR